MPEPPELHTNPALRLGLIVAGWLCVAVAVVGVVLPLLPTVPFLLLAAACFARGSDRCYRWLLANRIVGPLIRDWRETRTVPRRAKRTAQLLLVLTFGSTIIFFAPTLPVRIILAGLGTTAFVIVSRLPEPRPPGRRPRGEVS